MGNAERLRELRAVLKLISVIAREKHISTDKGWEAKLKQQALDRIAQQAEGALK